MAADNCNTNFGGVARNGTNNVYHILQQKVGHGLIGIGCFAHITHNAFDAACDKLPIDIESIIVKIYKHFSIYTVRVESLKLFCEDVNVEYEALTKHLHVRFLSLHPALVKIIKQYEPLKNYFRNQDSCPDAVAKFFADEDSMFWLVFLENQLDLSNEYVKKIETKADTSFSVADKINALQKKLQNRQRLSFMPSKAREIFNSKPDHKQTKLRGYVNVFYHTVLTYLETWSSAMDGTECFSWLNLQESLNWDRISITLDYIKAKVGQHLTEKIDGKFDLSLWPRPG